MDYSRVAASTIKQLTKKWNRILEKEKAKSLKDLLSFPK
jgi:hypothetical protein